MYETSDRNPTPDLRPLRVATRKENLWSEVKEMVADLGNWTVVSADDANLVLVCERKGGLLGGASKVTIRVDGPDGMPSSEVNLRAEGQGGLFGGEKAAVAEFLKPFIRRVC